MIYRVHLTDGAMFKFHNPADMPDPVKIEQHRRALDPRHHPHARDYLGAVLKLCQDAAARSASCATSAAAPWWSTTCR